MSYSEIRSSMGLTVKNMCFLLGGLRFEPEWSRVCTLYILSSQIAVWRRSLVPQIRGSHTSIWCLASHDLKLDYYYFITNYFPVRVSNACAPFHFFDVQN